MLDNLLLDIITEGILKDVKGLNKVFDQLDETSGTPFTFEDTPFKLSEEKEI